jgi:hypothetical protein
MSAEETILNTLQHYGYPCFPDLYTGESDHYFTYTLADERGTDFGDNEPNRLVSAWQIHLCLPVTENYRGLKSRIQKELFAAGFTWPAVTVVRVEKTRHVIFECSIALERED